MGVRFRLGRLAVFLAVFLAGSACNRIRSPLTRGQAAATGEHTAAADDGGAAYGRLSALAAEQLDAELQFSPTLATWLGDHTSDDRLDDVRLDAVAREVARLDNLLERLRRESDGGDALSLLSLPASTAGNDAVDGGQVDTLSPADLDRALLQARIEARRFELMEWRPHERNPLYYVNLIAFGLDSLLGPSLATPSGLRALRGRLAAIPTVCREAQRNLKNPPELWTKRAIDVTQMTRDFVAGLLPRMLANLNLTLDPKLQDDVSHQREVAQRALEEFGTWLSHDLLPRSKGDWVLGGDRLQARLRASELLDVPLTLIQERAEFEHREARRRLEELAKHLTGIANAGRAVAEAQRLLEEDHPRPEELTHAVEAALDKAYETASAQGLLSVPPQRPPVVEMPAYRFGYLQLSLPAPLEADLHAQLLLDPVDPSWKDKKRVSDHLRMLNRTQIALTISHDVMPGRFAQQQAQRAITAQLSPLRQRTRSLAFLEGWASYAEQVMAASLLQNPGPPPSTTASPAVGQGPGLGLLAAPVVSPERLQLLVLRQQLLRLGRLIVALRLHAPQSGSADASTRMEEAEDFFSGQCFLDEYAARREVERATHDPLYGAAALGRLQLLQLRADYQAEHHDDFSLKAFHDAVLAQGALPVVALRRLLLHHRGPSIRPPEEPEPEAGEAPE